VTSPSRRPVAIGAAIALAGVVIAGVALTRDPAADTRVVTTTSAGAGSGSASAEPSAEPSVQPSVQPSVEPSVEDSPDPRTVLPSGLTDADVEQGVRRAVAQVRSEAGSALLQELRFEGIRQITASDRPEFVVDLSARDVFFTANLAATRPTDPDLCEDPAAKCTEEARATAPNSVWFMPATDTVSGLRSRSAEVRMSYLTEGEEPWGVTVAANEAETGGPFPSGEDLGGLAFALASALVPAEAIPST
jgi:hypothetical protein